MEWPEGVPEPDDALLSFLEKLPPTIKDSVFAGGPSSALRMLGYGGPSGLDLIMDFPNMASHVRTALKEATDPACLCVMMIGAVEFALEHPEGDEEHYKELFEEYGVPVFRDIALRAPLRDRHFEAAREEFRSLRKTVLSAGFVRIWDSFLRARDLDESEQ